MSLVIVIPARLASTRLPNKLLLNETGTPLICHTVETACHALKAAPEFFSEVIVAADAVEIIAAVEAHCQEKKLPARAELTSPDHPSGSDRIAEVLRRLPDSVGGILNLQGDEPEMPAEDIIRLARILRDTEADIATLAFRITKREDFENPNLVKVVVGEAGEALYFSRAAIPYEREGRGGGASWGLGHLGIYAYTRAALERFVTLAPSPLEGREKLEQLRALENGMCIRVGQIDGAPPKGIDTAADYAAFVTRFRRASSSSPTA